MAAVRSFEVSMRWVFLIYTNLLKISPFGLTVNSIGRESSGCGNDSSYAHRATFRTPSVLLRLMLFSFPYF